MDILFDLLPYWIFLKDSQPAESLLVIFSKKKAIDISYWELFISNIVTNKFIKNKEF